MSDIQDLFAIVLPSGKGVRFSDLTPTQLDAVLLNAARALPPDSRSLMELTLLETKMGLEAMIKEVTSEPCERVPLEREFEEEQPDPADASKKIKVTVKKVVAMEYDVNNAKNKWVKFNPEAYESFIKNGRDHSVLKSIYSERNRVAPGEVAMILGKAVTVATP